MYEYLYFRLTKTMFKLSLFVGFASLYFKEFSGSLVIARYIFFNFDMYISSQLEVSVTIFFTIK